MWSRLEVLLLSPLAIVLLAGMSKHIDTLLLKGKKGEDEKVRRE